MSVVAIAAQTSRAECRFPLGTDSPHELEQREADIAEQFVVATYVDMRVIPASRPRLSVATMQRADSNSPRFTCALTRDAHIPAGIYRDALQDGGIAVAPFVTDVHGQDAVSRRVDLGFGRLLY